LFTLNGRMRFQVDLSEKNLQQFENQKLREIILGIENGQFCLTFAFAQTAGTVVDLRWPNYAVAIQDGVEAYPLRHCMPSEKLSLREA